MKRVLSKREQTFLEFFLAKSIRISSIVREIAAIGGKSFLVGGATRDLILKAKGGTVVMKDIDIEVHGVAMKKLKDILKKYGTVNEVGSSFGVLKFSGTVLIDWSIPRADSAGRKPKVIIDTKMGIKEALRRRDLTINAMAIDLVTNSLVDPYDGEKDLEKKILRATDKKLFVEDPLRFFRVMQFIARFEMKPDKDLEKICKKMDLSGISRERIHDEFKKTFLFSKRPSHSIRWLKQIGRLKEIIPELAETVGVKQSEVWHPEGDVFEHTMQVLDAIFEVAEEKKISDKERLILSLAALTHDLGKVTTTRFVDGKITSRSHDKAGVPLAKNVLARITGNKKIIAAAVKLTRYHMEAGSFIKNKAKAAAYKRLAVKLTPETNLRMLALICDGDKRGRNPKGPEPLKGPSKYVQEFTKMAKKVGVFNAPEKPLITGKDLINVMLPSKKMGAILKKAYEIQINEGINNRKTLHKRLVPFIEKP